MYHVQICPKLQFHIRHLIKYDTILIHIMHLKRGYNRKGNMQIYKNAKSMYVSMRYVKNL